MKKSFLNRFYAVVLSLVLLFGSCLVPSFSSYAVEPLTALKIAQYFLTVTGLVNFGDGLVERVTDEQLHSLEDVINACLSDGSIYVSSNGDYVFNSASTKAIYEELTNDASIDAKIVSNFSVWNNVINTNYVNSTFFQQVSDARLNFSSYLELFIQYSNSSSFYTDYVILDASDVSYFNSSLYSGRFVGLTFFNSNGSAKYGVSSYSTKCTYESSGGSFSNNNLRASNLNFLQCNENLTYQILYDDFPVVFYNDVIHCFYSNRSVVVACNNSSAGSTLVNKSSGIIYNNYYDIIPSVSQTVIEENNWENIYNSYVTNVNNEYQQIYETNGSVTAEEIRAILKDLGDRIDEIISDAGGEIIENLDDILTWLSRIYDRLDEIKNASGDNADVIAAIESVNDNLDLIKGDTLYLARLYALLGDILDKMNRGGSGRGYPDIVLDLPDIDNTNIMDYISTGQVIASTLETVLPFAYVPMLEQLLLSLSAEPVTPHWEIPFKIENSFVTIDETIVIDFEQFNTLRLVLNSLIMIGFLIFLIWFTFYLTDIVGNMLF